MEQHRAMPELIDLFYEALLGRAPDARGKQSWLEWIEGASPTVWEFANAFIGTPEFLARHSRVVSESLSDDLVEVIVNGTNMLLPRHDVVYSTAITDGIYEPHISAILHEFLKPGAVFLDVGSNVGVHSQSASDIIGQDGMVYAIDASIDNCAAHTKSLRHFDRQNVSVIPVAVGAAAGVEKISQDPISSNKVVRKRAEDDLTHSFENVFITTIDSILGHVSKVDLIKLDVEGREAGVVRGAIRLLARSRCPIIAEYLSYEGVYPDSEGSLIANLSDNYEISIIQADGRRVILEGQRHLLDAALAQTRSVGFSPVDLLFTPRR